MRDNKNSVQALDTITVWTKNSYEYVKMIASLRRLERLVPGQDGYIVTQLGCLC